MTRSDLIRVEQILGEAQGIITCIVLATDGLVDLGHGAAIATTADLAHEKIGEAIALLGKLNSSLP
jgi:hypothetical protein